MAAQSRKFEVLPVINCHVGDDDCVRQTLKTIREFALGAHLDVADGVFTFNKTWSNPELWKELAKGLSLEVHLMVETPEREAKKWLDVGVKRIIAHVEAIEDMKFKHIQRSPAAVYDELRKSCEEAGSMLMLSTNPETPVKRLEPYLSTCRYFQCLAVHPGPSGQKFLPVVLDKIKWIKEKRADAIVEVDGGVNPEVARQVYACGADVVVASHYIFSNPHPPAAYHTLVVTSNS